MWKSQKFKVNTWNVPNLFFCLGGNWKKEKGNSKDEIFEPKNHERELT